MEASQACASFFVPLHSYKFKVSFCICRDDGSARGDGGYASSGSGFFKRSFLCNPWAALEVSFGLQPTPPIVSTSEAVGKFIARSTDAAGAHVDRGLGAVVVPIATGEDAEDPGTPGNSQSDAEDDSRDTTV